MVSIGERLKSAWNVFRNDEERVEKFTPFYEGGGSSYRPDRVRSTYTNEKNIVQSLYARMALDVAAVDIRHVRLDDQQRYVETVQSGLNNCLSLEANIDQIHRALIIDAVLTMFEEGAVALVPVDTTFNPEQTGGFDILSMRVGKIVTWWPRKVRVEVYNDRKGVRQQVTLNKSSVAIIENPLYSVMNEPNSTLRRLMRKLTLLDAVDEQSSSGKLDLIIQLPYVIKSEARRQQAEQRRKDIEVQLKGSQYGIAYTDGTERITQLNRPAENQLMAQVEWLTNLLYSQLGLTPEVFDGSADEKIMLNYFNRTIEPILAAFTSEMKRKFLTKTARTQRQSIEYFRDPFKLVAIADIAEIADKFTRNEIMTGNEIRAIIGKAPAQDPAADELRNKNIPAADTVSQPASNREELQNGST